MPDLPLVPLVYVRLHRLERRVITRGERHPRVLLVVRGRPQVPARVIRRRRPSPFFPGSARRSRARFLVFGVQLPSPLPSFLLAHHLRDFLSHLRLLLLGKVVVFRLLRLFLRLFRPRLLFLRLLVLLAQNAIDVLRAHLAAAQAVHQARHVLHLLQERLGLVRARRQRALPEPGDLARRDRHRAGDSRPLVAHSEAEPNRSARFEARFRSWFR